MSTALRYQFPSSSIDLITISPLQYGTFIDEVLIPTAMVLIIQGDLGLTWAQASDVLYRSRIPGQLSHPLPDSSTDPKAEYHREACALTNHRALHQGVENYYIWYYAQTEKTLDEFFATGKDGMKGGRVLEVEVRPNMEAKAEMELDPDVDTLEEDDDEMDAEAKFEMELDPDADASGEEDVEYFTVKREEIEAAMSIRLNADLAGRTKENPIVLDLDD